MRRRLDGGKTRAGDCNAISIGPWASHASGC